MSPEVVQEEQYQNTELLRPILLTDIDRHVEMDFREVHTRVVHKLLEDLQALRGATWELQIAGYHRLKRKL